MSIYRAGRRNILQQRQITYRHTEDVSLRLRKEINLNTAEPQVQYKLTVSSWEMNMFNGTRGIQSRRWLLLFPPNSLRHRFPQLCCCNIMLWFGQFLCDVTLWAMDMSPQCISTALGIKVLRPRQRTCLSPPLMRYAKCPAEYILLGKCLAVTGCMRDPFKARCHFINVVEKVCRSDHYLPCHAHESLLSFHVVTLGCTCTIF